MKIDQSSLSLNACTFETTKNTFSPQYWKRCYDCWPNNEQAKGACLNCISVCHDGHTVDLKPRFSKFFCDCGNEKNCCKLRSLNPSPRFIIHPHPNPGRLPFGSPDTNPPTFPNRPPTFPNSPSHQPPATMMNGPLTGSMVPQTFEE